MNDMGIAAMSMDMSAAKLKMSVGVSLTKKTMEQQEVAISQLLEMIPAEPNSGIGQNIDVKA